MKKILLFLAFVAAGFAAHAQNTVALADAHWGFEASEAKTLVGQYNSTDRYVPAGWTSDNGYQSASTQYKPYIVTNSTNIYASEGSQALHLEGTAQANLPYVILPAITGVDNYNDLTLVFKVRPGYWSDFGAGEGMWSKCGSSDCRTIKVGHLSAIPDRENFATSVTHVWDTTFNAAGMLDAADVNPFCEVRIPMAGFGQYVAIYCEAAGNCYFCIDEVSIEGGEPAPADPYVIKLANAVWNFSDKDYSTNPAYKISSTYKTNTTSFVPANWCVDNESKRKEKSGSSAYMPFICPNAYALASNTTKFGMDDTLAIKFYHNTSNYKPYIMLPRISDADYSNLELEFYARQGVTSTETDYPSLLKIGYITNIADTANLYNNVTNLQELTVANGSEQNNYTKYTYSLSSVPANAYIVFYEGTAANNIVYFDNISIKSTAIVTPPVVDPDPQPLTKAALADSINWWVASSTHTGTTARATFVLHFQNGNVAYGYEWDGSEISAVEAMDEIIAADANLSASKTNSGQYYTTFTYNELTNTMSWGWGVSQNDAASFAAHSNLKIADEDMIIFSYDDMSVPKLAALTDIIFPEAVATPAGHTVTYNISNGTGDAANPTTIDEDETILDLTFTPADGYNWDGAEISVMMGSEEITEDVEEDNWYMADGSRDNLYIFAFDGFTADVVITITFKAATPSITPIAGPATFEEYTMLDAAGALYKPWSADGNYEWLSGDYTFTATISYGGYMTSGWWATNYHDNSYAGYDDAWKAVPQAAKEGNNYASVFYDSWGGANPGVVFNEAKTATGCYITNALNPYRCMTGLDTYATAFAAGDFFKVIATGYLNGVQGQSAEIYLGDFRDGKTFVAAEWMWFDLSALGTVDNVKFTIEDSQNGAGVGYYFCIDNFGAEAPVTTNVENLSVKNAQKVIIRGQLYIINGNHIYNANGCLVE